MEPRASLVADRRGAVPAEFPDSVRRQVGVFAADGDLRVAAMPSIAFVRVRLPCPSAPRPSVRAAAVSARPRPPRPHRDGLRTVFGRSKPGQLGRVGLTWSRVPEPPGRPPELGPGPDEAGGGRAWVSEEGAGRGSDRQWSGGDCGQAGPISPTRDRYPGARVRAAGSRLGEQGTPVRVRLRVLVVRGRARRRHARLAWMGGRDYAPWSS